MTNDNIINVLNIDITSLQPKKQQTEYKIKYVREYVLYWLKVSVNRPNIKYINFIDCMCNAGIYKDGDLCTSIEVLQLFITEAKYHTQIKFQLFLNDYNRERISIQKKIIDYYMEREGCNNISVFYDYKDVNEYITNFQTFDRYLLNDASNILFVDPYDLRTVRIDSIRIFIQKYYCEIIFNVMTYDFTRNKNDNRIFEMLGNNYAITSVNQLMSFIIERLRTGSMAYCFPFSFNNVKNSEIYQILFITPNIKGLEKLKEALRSIFKGMEKYKNNPPKIQGELFSLDDSNVEENVLLNCGKETQDEMLNFFRGKRISYKQIERFVLEKSVLAEHHIIRYILQPLLQEGKIYKCNITVNKSNFKQDEYKFG